MDAMDGPRQIAFEGMRVGGLRFKLRKTTDLEAPRPLEVGEYVSGEWAGVVIGVHFDDDDGDGVGTRTHVIEVRKATLG